MSPSHRFSLYLAFFISLTVPATAQVEQGAPLGISKGVLAAWTGTRDLAAGGELPLPMPATVALGDFTLSFVLELEPGKTGDIGSDVLLLTDPDSREVIAIQAAPSGRVIVRIGSLRLDAAARDLSTGNSPHQIVLSIRRDPRQALTGLWIDGVERASIAVPPGTTKLGKALLAETGRQLGGKISDVRLFDRSLTRAEIMDLAVEGVGAAFNTLKPFEEKLSLNPDEVIAIIGGSEANTLADDGSLEALLALQNPSQQLSLRNLAWEADTVFRQDRPLNFGDLAQQLHRVQATSIVLLFGRQECLDGGEAGMDKFREALGKIIAICQAQTPRLVILGLPGFDPPDKPKRDLTGENPIIAKYNALLRRIAADSKALFAEAPKPDLKRTEPLTFDGFNISKGGAWQLATQYLQITGSTEAAPDKRTDIAPLLTAIQAKNRLWHDYWRPTNWAFLHGDRTAQPSSRDHLDPKLRWFPAEQEKYLQLIREAEQQIHNLASSGLKTLP